MQLLPHPATPRGPVRSLDVAAERGPGQALRLSWRLDAELTALRIPAVAGSTRADGLWRHTCFEAFIARPPGPAYVELNFSPSGAWDARGFSAYRAGMARLAPPRSPDATRRDARGMLELEVIVQLDDLFGAATAGAATGPLRLALSAVIEERSGALTYWALRHPAGKPDFHHAEAFALELAATGAGATPEAREREVRH